MRVAVDMFHVPLPNPSGAEEPYHLLAVPWTASGGACTRHHLCHPAVLNKLLLSKPNWFLSKSPV